MRSGTILPSPSPSVRPPGGSTRVCAFLSLRASRALPVSRFVCARTHREKSATSCGSRPAPKTRRCMRTWPCDNGCHVRPSNRANSDAAPIGVSPCDLTTRPALVSRQAAIALVTSALFAAAVRVQTEEKARINKANEAALKAIGSMPLPRRPKPAAAPSIEALLAPAVAGGAPTSAIGGEKIADVRKVTERLPPLPYHAHGPAPKGPPDGSRWG